MRKRRGTLGAMRPSSITLVVLALGCGEAAPPATAPATEVLAWTSAHRYGASDLSEGDPIGADVEHIDRLTYSPQPLGGLLDPDLPDLRLEVAYTVGTRTMRREDGTTFTGLVPVSVRATTAEGTDWTISSHCDDTIAAPMPAPTPEGGFEYVDDTRFWQACWLDLGYGEQLRYGITIDVQGDGRLEGHAPTGAVTVARIR
jgi:hypothetical protein